MENVMVTIRGVTSPRLGWAVAQPKKKIYKIFICIFRPNRISARSVKKTKPNYTIHLQYLNWRIHTQTLSALVLRLASASHPAAPPPLRCLASPLHTSTALRPCSSLQVLALADLLCIPKCNGYFSII